MYKVHELTFNNAYLCWSSRYQPGDAGADICLVMHLPVNVQLSEHDILPKGKVSYLYKVLDRLLSSLPVGDNGQPSILHGH